jgi:hypothetical protein
MKAWPAAGMVACIALAGVNGLALVSAAYARLVERQLDRAESPAVEAAARTASALTPWSSQRLALQGWVAAERGDPVSEALYAGALRWAPADPLIWAELVLAQSRLGRFDDSMAVALRRANELAPRSPAVQGSNAAVGLSYWQRGSEVIRALWLESMRYELEHNSRTFLHAAMSRGQALTFCSGPGAALGIESWCRTIVRQGGCREFTGGDVGKCEFSR